MGASKYVHPLDPALARWFDALDEDAQELYQERAAIREHDGGMPRRQAEALAKEDVVAWLRRKTGSPPPGSSG